jgi:hypothetical protein
MERQFLNIVILLSFIISGCQQIPENNSNTIIQIENNDQDIKANIFRQGRQAIVLLQ